MKPTAKDSYILQDEITGDWAIVAPERMHRPFDIERKKKNNDPFAPTAIPKESIIAKYGRGENEMIVMRNAFPVFRRKR
ncbi:hypothetical protein KKE33_00140, partial [Patescibacteria group bacterium]|nr:hypothetical protein [Patescibacteria group bacterium]